MCHNLISGFQDSAVRLNDHYGTQLGVNFLGTWWLVWLVSETVDAQVNGVT